MWLQGGDPEKRKVEKSQPTYVEKVRGLFFFFNTLTKFKDLMGPSSETFMLSKRKKLK